MWPFSRNKFNKLKREDVVDAICNLEKEEADIEKQIEEKSKQVDTLMLKGRKEKTKDLKLFYAKKINHLQEEKKDLISRGMYMLYNLRLMEKLKTSIDDNSFFLKSNKISINSLLADQKNLAKFLNKALNTKVLAEDVLTNADSTFMEVKSLYSENADIYGVNNTDDELLAIFETQDEVEDDIADENGEENQVKREANKDGNI